MIGRIPPPPVARPAQPTRPQQPVRANAPNNGTRIVPGRETHPSSIPGRVTPDRIVIGPDGIPRSVTGAPLPTDAFTGRVLPLPSGSNPLPPGLRNRNALTIRNQLGNAIGNAGVALNRVKTNATRGTASRDFMQNALRNGSVRQRNGKFFDKAGFEVQVATRGPVRLQRTLGGERIEPDASRARQDPTSRPLPATPQTVPVRRLPRTPGGDGDVFERSDGRTVLNQRKIDRIGEVACGPTACAMIKADRGLQFDVKALARDAGLTLTSGSFTPDLANALKQNGVPNARFTPTASLTELAGATRGGSPAIVHLKGPTWPNGHFVVVDGFQNVGGKPFVAVRDPWGGSRYTMQANRFAREMTGDAVLTNPPGG